MPMLEEPSRPTHEGIINNDSDTFEEWVLAMAIHDHEFFNRVAGVLCRDHKTGEFKDDFRQPADNGIWQILVDYHSEIPGAKAPVISVGVAHALLLRLANEPRIIALSNVSDATEKVARLLTLNIAQLEPMVRKGFEYWLTKVRMGAIVNEQMRLDSWNPSELLESIELEMKQINRILTDDAQAFVAFDAVKEPPAVKLFPSGLRALDLSLGGGFGQAESSLVIAPSGGGKTVLATQLGANFSIRGQRTLLITTEQPPPELLARIASSTCNIPFERLRAGVESARLTPEEAERYRKMSRILGENLFFADWSKDRSRSIRADLRAEVERFITTHGRLDVLIFDWIGGALGALYGKDQHALRLAFQDTGDALADMAREFGAVVIGFGQAAIGTTRGKMCIDQGDIAECKSLGRSATNVIGISALCDKTDDDGPNFARVQYLHVSKARKSAGGLRRVVRQFEFQRFADL